MYIEHMNEATLIPDQVIDSWTPIEVNQLKSFLKDTLKGLLYLHKNEIIHADVKLENMLCYKNNKDYWVKLCDFGLAMRMENGFCTLKEFSGTLGYNAPEVTKGARVTDKIDMWSLGICLYEMAVAYKPSVLNKSFNKDGNVQFRDWDWKGYEEAKDLVLKLLKVNPEERISAEEALKHPFLDDEDSEDEFRNLHSV